MGRTALPLVLSQLSVVNPKGGQPAYVRSRRSIQTSARLKKFQACIADKMRGKSFSNREEVHAAFANAAHGCR